MNPGGSVQIQIQCKKKILKNTLKMVISAALNSLVKHQISKLFICLAFKNLNLELVTKAVG